MLKDIYGEKMIKSSEFDMNNIDFEIVKNILILILKKLNMLKFV